jgi:hypothetical protein
MPRQLGFLCVGFLVLLGLVAIGCGHSLLGGAISSHQIVALTISPATADAKNYPGGQVPFVATGTYKTPPITVSPLPANWGVIDQGGEQTTEVSITANGLVQCGSEAAGSYTVGAWVLLFATPPPVSCNVATPFGNPCGDSILATAQLTCP